MRSPLARFASFLRLAVLPAALTLAALQPIAACAQWTLKPIWQNLNDTWEGVLQASDGNFYTTSEFNAKVATPFTCNDNPDNACSYITKITPDGTATMFHTFEQADGQNNVDGMSPNPIIEASDGSFYGTALNGGTGGLGTIFKITPAGTFSVIFTFTHAYDSKGFEQNPPYGAFPGPLVEGSDGFLYGTTQIGGPSGGTYGTVYKVSKTGTMTCFMSLSDQGQATHAASRTDCFRSR